MRRSPRGSWTIAKVYGIPVRVHVSLLLIVGLLAVAFATQFEEVAAGGAALVPPLVWGAAVAVALFASVFVHELAHSVVALRAGARVRSITLMFIGGVSELGSELPRPRLEAIMAVAGPATSLMLGGLLTAFHRAVAGGIPGDVALALQLVAVMNVVLGAFNLLPAFPLDGGRLLRALLVRRLGRERATRHAAGVGKVFALGLGLLGLHFADLLMIVVAGFVWLAADREANEVSIRATLGRLRVSDAMSPARLVLPGELPLAAAAGRMLAARVETAAIAHADGRIGGAVSAGEIRRASPEALQRQTLLELVGPRAAPLAPTDSLLDAFGRLGESGAAALPVLGADGRLLGVLSRRDVERELALRPISARADPERPDGGPREGLFDAP